MSDIILPDGSSASNKKDDANRFNTDFIFSYNDFAIANGITQVGTNKINEWVDTIKNMYQYKAEPEEVIRFFQLPENSSEEDIKLRKYRVSVMIKNIDTQKRVIHLLCSFTWAEESSYMDIANKLMH